MIVRVQTGTSFKGAGLYYLHDKRLEGEKERLTEDRLAWTFALNTMEEEPEQVLAEMRKTAFDQPMLKLMSGNRIDGRPTEQPVMTVALSWSPEEQPTKAQMIEGAQSYLAKMGWQDLQCLMVAHNDTAHSHVHLILNRINPETGMTADQSWVQHRSGQWALAYEREQGKVLCPAREEKYGNDGAMNRREWETWQEISRAARAADPTHRDALKAGEWDALKQAQRDEREAFWKESTTLRRELRGEVARQVKGEFADEWKEYSEARDGSQAALQEARDELRKQLILSRGVLAPPVIAQLKHQLREQTAAEKAALKELREDIQERQAERLAEVGKEAHERLTQERAEAYEQLKASHREDKAVLRKDQAAGIRRPDLLDRQHAAAKSEIPASEASRQAEEQLRPEARPGEGLRPDTGRLAPDGPVEAHAPIAADKEVTDRQAAKQNEDAKPRTDRQAWREASDAQARAEASNRGRGRGDDDGGGRDR